MKKILELAHNFLKNFPDIPYEYTEGSEICVNAKNTIGFDVRIMIIDELLVEVRLDEWFKEFTTTDDNEIEEAFNYFKLALTRNFRIKEYIRGSTPYKWALEFKTPEGWKQDSVRSKMNLKMWLSRRTKYLQNDWYKL